MRWDVLEVSVVSEYTILVRFEDGLEGRVVFLPSAFRGVFSHLSDRSTFIRIKVIDGVVTWPGGVDLAPDAMYKEIVANGQWILS